MKRERTIPVILGPTCVGKTSLSIELALSLGAEVVSCDSRQVYIGMNVGTAKPPYYIQQIIPHHLIDILYPDDSFNARVWAELAERSIKEIIKKNRKPLIACGTGLYLSALTDGFFSLPELTDEKRKIIELKIDEIEKKIPLYDYLKKIDSESALRIHKNDRYRTKRAIEIFLLTGKPVSYHRMKGKQKRNEKICYIGLTMNRGQLYKKIESRVDSMVKNGFVEEVEHLLSLGYRKNLAAFQAPGYRELIRFLKGETSLKDAISQTKKRTRNYAKRQFTWFRKLEGVTWFDISLGYKAILKRTVDLCLSM